MPAVQIHWEKHTDEFLITTLIRLEEICSRASTNNVFGLQAHRWREDIVRVLSERAMAESPAR